MNIRSKLISDTLTPRFRELCDRNIPGLGYMEFACGVQPFADRVREHLSGALPADFAGEMRGMKWRDTWVETQEPSSLTFRAALFAISLGSPMHLDSKEHPPVEPFMEVLTAMASEPRLRAQLLMYRYSYPLNFTLPEEDAVREYILTRVMSRDRSLIEKGALDGIDGDDLMVMLNLVAVHATRSPDLRFLDALNYYYELLPTNWFSRAQQQAVLLASYFALYARALAAWIREDT